MHISLRVLIIEITFTYHCNMKKRDRVIFLKVIFSNNSVDDESRIFIVLIDILRQPSISEEITYCTSQQTPMKIH